MKIFLLFGTRPEYIKIAPVAIELKKQLNIDLKVVFSRQHTNMVENFFPIFNVYPDITLDVNNDGDLSNLSAQILKELNIAIKNEMPDILLVHGDTTTAMIGALCGFYNNIRIGHIEAGLRTFDIKSPFPEEMNRQVIRKYATLHFAATAINKQNLLKEDVHEDKIFVVGNTSIDAIKFIVEKNIEPSKHVKEICDQENNIGLLTMHRRENIDKIENILNSIKLSLVKHPNLKLLLPMHLNPSIRAKVQQHCMNCEHIILTEPLDYIDLAYVMSCSKILMTDSGGLQEEVTFFGIPVIVLRNNTERVEIIQQKVGLMMNISKLSEQVDDILSGRFIASKCFPYGNGDTAKKIVNVLVNL